MGREGAAPHGGGAAPTTDGGAAAVGPLLWPFGALAAFFGAWTLLFPASWLIGSLPRYRGPPTITWVVRRGGGARGVAAAHAAAAARAAVAAHLPGRAPVPQALGLVAAEPAHALNTPRAPRHRPQKAAETHSLQRFAPWPSIRLLHCLAGGVWCVAVLAQLATAARMAGAARGSGRRRRPGGSSPQAAASPAAAALSLHRASGRAALAAAAAVVAGYWLMEARGLIAGAHGPLVAATFYRPLASYFAGTAVMAARAAAAGHRDAHAAHAARHAAAGLAFAAARVLVVAVGGLLHAAGVGDPAAGEAQRSRAFYACSYGAAVLCVGGAELVLALGRRRRRRHDRNRKG
jgi:hypothetical protein